MDYIVSAEDTPYYHWQLEFLIESFKRHGLQDRLLVALAGQPTKSPYRKNLDRHKRVITHDNIGRLRGYPYLNKPYAVSTAVSAGKVKQPFTVIEPDMLLYQPVRKQGQPIAFQVRDELTLEAAASHLPNIKRHIKGVCKNDSLWIPLGSVYIFDGVPDEFFTRAVSWAELLAYESYKAGESYWRDTEKAGWALAMLAYHGHLPFKGTRSYEMTFMDSEPANLIHYTHGMPPVFSKYMFRYEPPEYLAAAESPFHPFLHDAPTPPALFAQQVAKSYLGR